MTVAHNSSPLAKPFVNHGGFDISETEDFDTRIGYADGNQQGTPRSGTQNGGNLLGRKIQALWTDSSDDTLLFQWDVRNEEAYQGAIARLHVTGPGINRFFDPWDAILFDPEFLNAGAGWTFQITAPELFVIDEQYFFDVDLTKNKTV